MATIKSRYLGNLRMESTHTQSGTKIITDAPTDNKGKGEAFSPTDLCVAALGSCIMTIAGMYCQENNIDIVGTELEIDKIMNDNPRRIGEVIINFNMPDREYSKKEKTIIERTAKACPVHLSLHPDTKQTFIFNWKR
jgi:uncharacterized OsmC-like protein